MTDAFKKDWQEQVWDEALKMAQVIEHNFDFGMKEALKLLPEDKPENRRVQLDMFLNCLTAATADCAAKYFSDSEEVENHVRDSISHKFGMIRKAKADLEAKKAAGIKLV